MFYTLRFHRFQRQHKISILVTCIGVFCVSILNIIIGFSGDSVFGQVNFRIAILALPECQNHIDDDGDGLVDYPDDTDCTDLSDTSEGVITPPTVVCFTSSSTALIEQSVSWIAVPSNGNGVYTYSWSGTDGLVGTDVSVAKIYSAIGIKTAAVTVTS